MLLGLRFQMWPIPLEGPTLLKHTATVFPHNTQSREGIPFPRVILNIMCLRLNFKNQQIKLPSQDALIHSHSFKGKGGSWDVCGSLCIL